MSAVGNMSVSNRMLHVFVTILTCSYNFWGQVFPCFFRLWGTSAFSWSSSWWLSYSMPFFQIFWATAVKRIVWNVTITSRLSFLSLINCSTLTVSLFKYIWPFWWLGCGWLSTNTLFIDWGRLNFNQIFIFKVLLTMLSWSVSFPNKLQNSI